MTETNNKRIKQLSRTHPVLYAAMQAHRNGMCSYTEALEMAVLMLAASEGEYKTMLLDIVKSEGPRPITMPIDEFCKNHCARSHG